jgi:hypothetical protein
MPLPPRPLYTLTDVAIRWSAMPIDVVGWATDGLLVLSIAVPPVRTISSRMVCDVVNVSGTDIRPLFRPDGARLGRVSVRRVREPGQNEWQWISEPAEGIIITAPEVLITRAEVQRFELEHELGRSNISAAPSLGSSERCRGAGPGVPPRYDWDTFFGALARRIHDNGLPSTQAELVREMLAWFQTRPEEHAPDESTVRRKIAVVWRELKRA